MKHSQAECFHDCISDRGHNHFLFHDVLLLAGVNVQTKLDRRARRDLGIALGRGTNNRLARLRDTEVFGQVDFDGQDLTLDFGFYVLHDFSLSCG